MVFMIHALASDTLGVVCEFMDTVQRCLLRDVCKQLRKVRKPESFLLGDLVDPTTIEYMLLVDRQGTLMRQARKGGDTNSSCELYMRKMCRYAAACGNISLLGWIRAHYVHFDVHYAMLGAGECKDSLVLDYMVDQSSYPMIIQVEWTETARIASREKNLVVSVTHVCPCAHLELAFIGAVDKGNVHILRDLAFKWKINIRIKPLCLYALSLDRPETLGWVHSLNPRVFETSYFRDLCIANGRTMCAYWFDRNTVLCDRTVMSMAIAAACDDNMKMYELAMRRRAVVESPDLCAQIAGVTHPRFLRLARSLGSPLDERVCLALVSFGDIETLRWAVEQGAVIEPIRGAFRKAVANGHLDVIRVLYEMGHDCPNDVMRSWAIGLKQPLILDWIDSRV